MLQFITWISRFLLPVASVASSTSISFGPTTPVVQVETWGYTLDTDVHCRKASEINDAILCVAKNRTSLNALAGRASYFIEGRPSRQIVKLVDESFLSSPQSRYRGHNLSSDDLSAFYEQISSRCSQNKDFCLNPIEAGLRKYLEKEFIKFGRRKFIVLALEATNGHLYSSATHELAHARFFLDEKYRQKIVSFWDHKVESHIQQVAKETLSRSYNLDAEGKELLLVDEFQAYMLQDRAEIDSMAAFVPFYRSQLKSHLKKHDPLPSQRKGNYCLEEYLPDSSPLRIEKRDDPSMRGTFATFNNFSAFCLSGLIIEAYWESAFRDFTTEKKELVVLLDSEGGFSSEAKKMSSTLMKLRKKGIKVHTRLGKNSFCGSACLFIFMAGDVRTADPTAKFGFHSGQNISTGIMASREEQMSRYIQPLIDLGIDTQFFNRLIERGTFSSTDFTVLPASFPEIPTSGLVTEIVSDEVFSSSLRIR